MPIVCDSPRRQRQVLQAISRPGIAVRLAARFDYWPSSRCLGQVTRERASPDRCHGKGRQTLSASKITPSTVLATELPSSRKGGPRRNIRIYPLRCPAPDHRAVTADEEPRVVHSTETVPSLRMRSKAGWLTHNAEMASLDSKSAVLFTLPVASRLHLKKPTSTGIFTCAPSGRRMIIG
jgi:hypothetical protein